MHLILSKKENKTDSKMSHSMLIAGTPANCFMCRVSSPTKNTEKDPLLSG